MIAVMYVGVCIYTRAINGEWLGWLLASQLLSIKAVPPYNLVLQIPNAISHEMEEENWEIEPKWGWAFLFGKGCSLTTVATAL